MNTPKGKPGGTSVNVGKGGVNVHTHPKGKKPPVYVGVKPGSNPFNYQYAATQTQLHDNSLPIFFLEKTIRPGSKLSTLNYFSKTSQISSIFSPRQLATSLPFSSKNLPEILHHFSLEPASPEAESIQTTLNECEASGNAGEEKRCTTSLESMVDFSISKLGRHVALIATEIKKDADLSQEFTVVNSEKKSKRDMAVVCHKLSYPYAVFYCHSTKQTRAYRVRLVGADGATTANVAAVCHTDTSAWNSKHLAFQVLKVKPGTVPVCHFLPRDHLVWVSKY